MGTLQRTEADIKEDFKILKKSCQILIIPPIQNKTSAYMKNDYIGQQWLEAREILLNAQEVDIIGYSSPTTDIATNLMLQDALNRKDCKINICYKCEEKEEGSLKDRYKNTFNLLRPKFYGSGL